MKLTYHNDNLRKHNVTPNEVDECLADPDKVYLKRKTIVLIIAKTFSGRILEIGINENCFVFHAMDASKYFYKHYKGR